MIFKKKSKILRIFQVILRVKLFITNNFVHLNNKRIIFAARRAKPKKKKKETL